MTKNFVHEIHLRPRQCDWLKRFNLNGRSFEKSVSCCEMTRISGNFRYYQSLFSTFTSYLLCICMRWCACIRAFLCVCVTSSVMHVKRCINASKHPKIICNIKFYLIISERNVEQKTIIKIRFPSEALFFFCVGSFSAASFIVSARAASNGWEKKAVSPLLKTE